MTTAPSILVRPLRGRVPAALAACAAAALLWSTAAHAQTLGAPLNLPANTTEGCETVVFPSLRSVIGVPPSCTFFGADSAGEWTSQTPRGSWVITQARVRTGPRVGPMVFTVIRVLRSQASTFDSPGVSGAICCTSPVESQVFTPAPNTVNTIPVQIPVVNGVQMIDGEPVEVVDYLGVTLLSLGSSVPVHVAAAGAPGSTAHTSFFAPAIRAGQQRLSDGTLLQPGVLLVNGDYQPAGAGTPAAPAPTGTPAAPAPTGTPTPPAPTGTPAVPALTALDLSRARFAAARSGPSVRAARSTPVGTTITYGLSAASTTTFRVKRRGAGRRVRGKCRKRTRRNRRHRKCARRLKGRFKHEGSAGENSFLFTGRLRRRTLKPGRYVLVARAKDEAGGKSKLKRTRFRIVRG